MAHIYALYLHDFTTAASTGTRTVQTTLARKWSTRVSGRPGTLPQCGLACGAPAPKQPMTIVVLDGQHGVCACQGGFHMHVCVSRKSAGCSSLHCNTTHLSNGLSVPTRRASMEDIPLEFTMRTSAYANGYEDRTTIYSGVVLLLEVGASLCSHTGRISGALHMHKAEHLMTTTSKQTDTTLPYCKWAGGWGVRQRVVGVPAWRVATILAQGPECGFRMHCLCTGKAADTC